MNVEVFLDGNLVMRVFLGSAADWVGMLARIRNLCTSVRPHAVDVWVTNGHPLVPVPDAALQACAYRPDDLWGFEVTEDAGEILGWYTIKSAGVIRAKIPIGRGTDARPPAIVLPAMYVRETPQERANS